MRRIVLIDNILDAHICQGLIDAAKAHLAEVLEVSFEALDETFRSGSHTNDDRYEVIELGKDGGEFQTLVCFEFHY